MFRKKINSLGAFTLIELVLVIIIILLVYGIFFSKQLLISQNSKTIDLMDIKSVLQTYEFEKQIELKCTDEDFRCFVLVDGELKEELKDKLFTEKATVYTYEKKPKVINFMDLKMENMESYPIFFNYKLDRFGKSKDMIVETNNGVYLFNSVLAKPIKFEHLPDINDYFENQIKKVKDVF